MANNWTGNTLNVPAGALSSTSMRYHELALQRWLNRIFTLRWGVPVPVVFTSPMDAFSLFSKLWSEANNPYQYLLDVKDESGVPVYQPYPAPVRYPVISVYRNRWKYRHYQNFSIHRMRWINWPTVSDNRPPLYGVDQQGTDLTLCNLGEVTTSRFPMAWDYRFQIDHFCNRPDTQSFLLSQLFREFWRTGGSVLQTWIKVSYPGFGDKLVRLYLEGEVQSLTPEEPADGQNVEYRTSFTVVIEGYDIDLNYKIYPALWKFILREGSAPPEALNSAFEFTGTVDLREDPQSSIVDYRETVTVMPDAGTCATDIRDTRLESIPYIQFIGIPGDLPTFGSGTIFAGTVPPPAFVDSGTNNGTFTVSAFGSYWTDILFVDTDAGTNTSNFTVAVFGTYASAGYVSEDTGTDAQSMIVSFGNICEYQLYNFTDYGTFLASPFGTHFDAIRGAFDGTDYSNISSSAFGTYTDATVLVESGTEYGTIAISLSGTYVPVTVVVDAVTESGTLNIAHYGTYLDVTVDGGTLSNNGTMWVYPYGQYTLV